MTEIKEIIAKIEEFAPKSLALPGDPVGLQIGSADEGITKALVTLDVRPEIVQEAIDSNIHFIFSHHPAMFKPATNLDYRDPQNAMYAEIIKHDITVYSAHTNIDCAKHGMNDWLAEKLQLEQIKPFAFELNEDGCPIGLGRKGVLKQPVELANFAEKIKQIFKLEGLRLIANNPHQLIQKVGIIGGDGGKYFQQAITNQLDLFITGDVYYHTGHDMLAANLAVIDPGHHIEQIFKRVMSDKLNEWSAANKWGVDFVPSQISTDPYQFI